MDWVYHNTVRSLRVVRLIEAINTEHQKAEKTVNNKYAQQQIRSICCGESLSTKSAVKKIMVCIFNTLENNLHRNIKKICVFHTEFGYEQK